MAQLRPCDLDAWIAFRRERMPGRDLALDVLAIFMKEPAAVQAFARHASKLPEMYEATQLVEALVATIRDLDGKRCCATGAAMGTSRASRSFSGLAFVGRNLGLLAAPSSGPQGNMGLEVSLGPGQDRWLLASAAGPWHEAVGKVRSLVSRCRAAPARPQNSADLAAYALSVSSILKSLPSCWALGGGYVCLSVLRKLLLGELAVSGLDDAFCSSALTLSDMQAWVPDVGQRLGSLPGETPLAEIRRTFGVHPLELSMWACLWHGALRSAQDQDLGLMVSELAVVAVSLRQRRGTNPSPVQCVRVCLRRRRGLADSSSDGGEAEADAWGDGALSDSDPGAGTPGHRAAGPSAARRRRRGRGSLAGAPCPIAGASVKGTPVKGTPVKGTPPRRLRGDRQGSDRRGSDRRGSDGLASDRRRSDGRDRRVGDGRGSDGRGSARPHKRAAGSSPRGQAGVARMPGEERPAAAAAGSARSSKEEAVDGPRPRRRCRETRAGSVG